METPAPVPPKPPTSPIKEEILRRVKVLYIIFLVVGLAVIGRIIWLQTGTDADTLRSRAQRYSYRTDLLEADRGNIYSDDGRLLATSIPYYELRMDMRASGLSREVFEEHLDSLSLSLAGFFQDKDKKQYYEELREAYEEGKRYHPVTRRRINYLELQTVKRFPLFRLGPNKGGFIAVENGRRIYPHGELGRRTIGFVNQAGTKVGVEGSFDDYLRGTDGLTVKQKISGNFWTPVAHPSNIEPTDGMDVVTTLNIEMQDMVQDALRERVVEAGADWGCVIVMEVATGEVKALSNVTRTPDGKLQEDYNYAIGMSMEPGSTFKLPVLMALVEDGHMPLSTMLDTEGGRVQIGPVRVVDTRAGGYGRITLQEVFEKSSNIGMAKAVNQLYRDNPSRFVDALMALGVHKPLDLQIAGEARPLVKHPGNRSNWDGMTLTMMSYGYALRLAPIHTLALYNAVANNGVMVKPMFVRELREQGETIETFRTDTLTERLCSPQTLQAARQALEGVVQNGTGRLLKTDKYTVAAKTGTAQIAIGRSGYRTASGGRHYLASVAGYMPADKPQYSIIVVMKTYYEPGSGKSYYGAQLAGPLFKSVTDRIYAVGPGFRESIDRKATPYAPTLTAMPGPSAELKELMEELAVLGSPLLPPDESVALLDGEVIPAGYVSTTAGVPSLEGMTLEEALRATEEAGLRPVFRGLGTVRSQSLEPGEPFEPGTEIILTLGVR